MESITAEPQISAGRGNTVEMANHPNIIKGEDLKEREYFGLGYELFWCMNKYKKYIAQYIFETNTEETYEILLQKSIRAALQLKSKHLGKDPIIAICAENHSNTCIPFFAASFLGFTVATFDGSISVADSSFLLKQVTPSVMFIDEKFVKGMESAIQMSGKKFQLVVFGKHEIHETFDEYLHPKDEEEERMFEPVKPESNKETAVILFSSGTTGLPKGICLSHMGLLGSSELAGCMNNFSHESVVLYFNSLNWITSFLFLISSTLCGASRVITPVSTAWEVIDKYKVTFLYASPYTLSVMVNQDKPERLQAKSLKFVVGGGAKLNAAVWSKMESLAPEALVAQVYGQSEVGGYISTFKHYKKEDCLIARKKTDSVGRSIPGLWYKIVDRNTGLILGQNQIGELHVKSKFCMKGYFNVDSSETLDSDGWVKTGDLIYYDQDQCFFLVGRCKEMLKFRSFHIQPQMLEAILETHPAVARSVVMGVPHEIDGDHPMGLVVLKNGHEDTTSKEIELYVEERVDEKQRLRGGVKIIKSIPLTSTGKPKRLLLKELFENGKLE